MKSKGLSPKQGMTIRSIWLILKTLVKLLMRSKTYSKSKILTQGILLIHWLLWLLVWLRLLSCLRLLILAISNRLVCRKVSFLIIDRLRNMLWLRCQIEVIRRVSCLMNLILHLMDYWIRVLIRGIIRMEKDSLRRLILIELKIRKVSSNLIDRIFLRVLNN